MPDPSAPHLEHDHEPKSVLSSGICITSLVVGGLSILLCWIPIIGIIAIPLYWLGLLLGGAGLIFAFVDRNQNSIAYALIGAVLSASAWYMGSIQQRVVQGAVGGALTAVDSTFNTIDSSLDAVGNATKSISDSWEASKKETEEREKAEKEKEAKANEEFVRRQEEYKAHERIMRPLREKAEREEREANEKAVRELHENYERLAREKAEREAIEKAEREEAQYRTWASASGSFTTKAKLLSYGSGAITVETREGKKIKVSLEKLSKDDQEFVAKWRREKR